MEILCRMRGSWPKRREKERHTLEIAILDLGIHTHGHCDSEYSVYRITGEYLNE